MEKLPEFITMRVGEVNELIRDHFFFCMDHREVLLEQCQSDHRKGIQNLGMQFLDKEARYLEECARVRSMYDFDGSYGDVVAGVDEVGRGPLAGPIVGAAVILKNDCATKELILGINDSKKLSRQKREELAPLIRRQALAWSISLHSNDDIDNFGLSFCNNNIFLRAIQGLQLQPQVVLTDGYPIKGYPGHKETVIKGDLKSAAIACASIIAKVYRDDLMGEYDTIYPGYGFTGNVGYGSSDHIAAIKTHGPSPIHRRSFLTRILEEDTSVTKYP